MSTYSELVKNFEKIRTYMRDFYVYGFKSREDFNRKSARSYDDERRRIESFLDEHMRFVHTADGKNIFISIDSRSGMENPLYKAWKAKSFTDGDITLHFVLFDVLYDAKIALTLSEIMDKIDDYLSSFSTVRVFDESTVRKKLKEYAGMGLVVIQKQGKRMLYKRTESLLMTSLADPIGYFSESMPCGVIGSFLQDREGEKQSVFSFKHHYINSTLDSDVAAILFCAMHEKAEVRIKNRRRGVLEPIDLIIVPLRIFISAQNGRQHVLAYVPKFDKILSYRIDYLSDPKIGERFADFDEKREMLAEMQKYMWGVNCRGEKGKTEHVEFTVFVDDGEEHIVHRLLREKRIGTVERIDEHHMRFVADVYDTGELIPWIRTFICRITRLNFENRTIENQFKKDIEEMYRMYGVSGEEET